MPVVMRCEPRVRRYGYDTVSSHVAVKVSSFGVHFAGEPLADPSTTPSPSSPLATGSGSGSSGSGSGSGSGGSTSGSATHVVDDDTIPAVNGTDSLTTLRPSKLSSTSTSLIAVGAVIFVAAIVMGVVLFHRRRRAGSNRPDSAASLGAADGVTALTTAATTGQRPDRRRGSSRGRARGRGGDAVTALLTSAGSSTEADAGAEVVPQHAAATTHGRGARVVVARQSSANAEPAPGVYATACCSLVVAPGNMHRCVSSRVYCVDYMSSWVHVNTDADGTRGC